MIEKLPGKANRSRLLRWGGTLLSLALLVYLANRQWGAILEAFTDLSFTTLMSCLGIMFVSRIAVGSRWHALLLATDLKVTWWQSQKITFAGLFASNFLPSTIGGDVVRLLGAVQSNLSGTISAASLIVDRLAGMLGMALMLPLGLAPLWGWYVSQYRILENPDSILFTAGMVSKGFQRVQDWVQRFWQAFKLWQSKPLSLIFALVFTLVHQACIYGIITFLLIDLGEPLSFWVVAGLWSFIYFITLLPISINGYGVQELALLFFFTQVVGVSEPASLAVATLVRLTQMFASLPGAFFVPGIMAGTPKEG